MATVVLLSACLSGARSPPTSASLFMGFASAIIPFAAPPPSNPLPCLPTSITATSEWLVAPPTPLPLPPPPPLPVAPPLPPSPPLSLFTPPCPPSLPPHPPVPAPTADAPNPNATLTGAMPCLGCTTPIPLLPACMPGCRCCPLCCSCCDCSKICRSSSGRS